MCCLCFHFDPDQYVTRAKQLYCKYQAQIPRLFIFKDSFEQLQKIAYTEFGALLIVYIGSKIKMHPSAQVLCPNFFDAKHFVHVKITSSGFVLIHKPELYHNDVLCVWCLRSFKTTNCLNNHLNGRCKVKVAGLAPGSIPKPDICEKVGPWRKSKTLFNELEEINVHTTPAQRQTLFKDLFAVFDTESYLLGANMQMQNSIITEEHSLCLISVDHNLSEDNSFHMFTPVSSTDNTIVERFVKHLLELADVSYSMYRDRHQILFDNIETQLRCATDNMKDKIESIQARLHAHYNKLPIFNFNGSRYDLAMLRRSGLFNILKQLDPPVSVLKRSNTEYISISSKRLKFLDILQISGFKISYAEYLSKYYGDSSAQKLTYPYKLLKNFASLSGPLPSYHDFDDDSLSGCNLLDKHYQLYLKVKAATGCSHAALRQLGLTQIPETGHQLFEKVREEWENSGHETFGDIIKQYVKNDTTPMLRIVTDIIRMYRSRDLDITNYVTISSAIFDGLISDLPAQHGNPIWLFDGEFRQLCEANKIGGLSQVREY